MKRRTTLLAIAASLLASMATSVQAAPVLINRIGSITPAQASVGQVIEVIVTRPELDPAIAKLIQINKNRFIDLATRFPSNLSSRFTPNYKVFFTGPGSTFVEGQNLTSLGNNRYSVVVPQGARTGRLKLVNGTGSQAPSSLSTGTFTVSNLGIAFFNNSQYNMVSIKVNGVEQLTGNQVVVPGGFGDLGLPAGSNYRVIYSIGIDRNRPILTRDGGTVTARPFSAAEGGFPIAVTAERLTAREMLRSTPSFTLNGNLMTSRWMGFNVLTGFFDGYDFISDTTTGAMSFRKWQGDPANIIASGPVNEPSSWANLVSQIAVPLRNQNNSLHANMAITLTNPGFLPSFITGDGLTYEPF
ncbi:hypothetical protein GCM10023213_38450 [Prosthecobacter algae]|uniref:Uncharacterized protein n=1 Tax=Prosthecobacter algae TaxID=1144682 RepID=A0ABP9PG05_9BACT